MNLKLARKRVREYLGSPFGALGGLGNTGGFNSLYNTVLQNMGQSMANQWHLTSTTSNTNYSYGADPAAHKAAKPGSALEWLDRRVNEIRVRL